MNEIKSYEIKLETKDRINLYLSGALTWNQIFTKEPFYVKQNELQWLFDVRVKQDHFVCAFERDSQLHNLHLDKALYPVLLKENEHLVQTKSVAPWRVFRYAKSVAVLLFLSWMLTSILLFSVNTTTLISTFKSETCDAQCAKMMSAVSVAFLTLAIFTFVFPAIYFLLRRMFIKKFKFKPGRPLMECISFATLVFAQAPMVYRFYSQPQVAQTISHWKNGTLNKETIAQMKLDFKKQRTVEAHTANESE